MWRFSTRNVFPQEKLHIQTAPQGAKILKCPILATEPIAPHQNMHKNWLEMDVKRSSVKEKSRLRRYHHQMDTTDICCSLRSRLWLARLYRVAVLGEYNSFLSHSKSIRDCNGSFGGFLRSARALSWSWGRRVWSSKKTVTVTVKIVKVVLTNDKRSNNRSLYSIEEFD